MPKAPHFAKLLHRSFRRISDKITGHRLEELAANGNIEAEFYLGQLYWHGDEGIAQDSDLAKDLCTKVAAQGIPEAQFYLFHILLEKERSTESLGWLKKAARKGFSEACYTLGQAYEIGLYGATENQTKAKYFYRKAAHKGDWRATMRANNWHRHLEEDSKLFYHLPWLATFIVAEAVILSPGLFGIDIDSIGAAILTIPILGAIALAWHYQTNIQPNIEQANRMYALNTVEANLSLIDFSFEQLTGFNANNRYRGDANYTFGLAHKFYKSKIQDCLYRLKSSIDNGDTDKIRVIVERSQKWLSDRNERIRLSIPIRNLRDSGLKTIS